MLRQIVGLLCLGGCLLSTASILYYFFSMLAGVKPGKKRLAQAVGPFMLFMPQLWDEAGNRARIRTLFSALAFGICFGGVALAAKFLPLTD